MIGIGRIGWLSDKNIAMLSVVIATTWWLVGYGMAADAEFTSRRASARVAIRSNLRWVPGIVPRSGDTAHPYAPHGPRR